MSAESPLLRDVVAADADSRRRVQNAQRALQHIDGEPLTVLSALAGYEAAANAQGYCRYGWMEKVGHCHRFLLFVGLCACCYCFVKTVFVVIALFFCSDKHKNTHVLHVSHNIRTQPSHATFCSACTPAAQAPSPCHRERGLHIRLMSDMAALHRQLRGLVHSALGGPLDNLSLPPGGAPVPPPSVSRALRRAMVAGWIDRVARRVTAQEAAGQVVRC